MISFFKGKTKKDVEGAKKTLWFDEAGWERAKRVYRGIWTQSQSLEPDLIRQFCYQSFIAGFVLGSCIQARPLFMDMRERFNEYQFRGAREYARRISDMTLLAASRHGLKIGVRMCFLTTSWAYITTTLTSYHNEIRISNFIISSALTGAAYDFYRGPGRMLASAVILCLTVGLPLGLCCKGYLWIIGMDYPAYRRRYHDYTDASFAKANARRLEWDQKWRQILYGRSAPEDSQTKVLDHDKLIADLADKGLKDDSFPQYADAPNRRNVAKIDD